MNHAGKENAMVSCETRGTMPRFWIARTSTLLVLTVFACTRGGSPLEQLQGDWRATLAVSAGDEEELVEWDPLLISIIDDRLDLTGPRGFGERSFTISLNPEQSPAWIDMVTVGGRFDGEVGKGIYELKDGTLKLCLPNRDLTRRPRAFRSDSESGDVLLILVRDE